MRIGDVLLQICEENPPCFVIGRQCKGMRKALKPNWRAGIACSVIQGGFVQAGDRVYLERAVKAVKGERPLLRPVGGKINSQDFSFFRMLGEFATLHLSLFHFPTVRYRRRGANRDMPGLPEGRATRASCAGLGSPCREWHCQ